MKQQYIYIYIYLTHLQGFGNQIFCDWSQGKCLKQYSSKKCKEIHDKGFIKLNKLSFFSFGYSKILIDDLLPLFGEVGEKYYLNFHDRQSKKEVN